MIIIRNKPYLLFPSHTILHLLYSPTKMHLKVQVYISFIEN